MADPMRTYSKSNPDKEPQPHQLRKTVEAEVQVLPIGEVLTDNYKKPDLEELPKGFFVIISGGQVREKDYFKIISHQDNFQRIKLEYISESNRLVDPTRLYELAIYKKGRLESSRNEDAELDKIYLISDVDEFINDLMKIKPLCINENFPLIISNPCFELWLYYANRTDVPDFHIPEKLSKISWKFKGWADTAVKGGVKSKRAIFNIYSNIENARKNYKEDENGIPELFSTNMFQLAEDLLPFVEPELSNMIEENMKIETKFREQKKK